MLSRYLASASTKVVKTQVSRAVGFSRTRAFSLFTNQGKNSVIPVCRPHYSRQFSSKSPFGIRYMLSATNRQFRVRPLLKEINQKAIQKKRHMSSTAGSEDAGYKMFDMFVMNKTQLALLVNFCTAIFGVWKINEQEEMTQETKRKTMELDQKLTAQAKTEEQKKTAQDSVHKARRALLISAMRLLAEIHNIQHRDFFDYLRDDERKEIAMQSTLYDFSKYWCLSNKLYLEVDLLHSNNDILGSDSQRISTKLNEVTRACATDSLSKNLMIWTNEQRAVGELMLDDTGQPLGFCAFTKEYTTGKDWGLKKWLKKFEADLWKLENSTSLLRAKKETVASETIRKEINTRLTKLGNSLSGLLHLLDKDNSILEEWQKDMVKKYENNENV